MTAISEKKVDVGAGQAESLARIRAGDREAAAAFLASHEDLLRHRHKWRLRRGRQVAGGTDDLLSTVRRRFDRLVSRGDVRASGVGRLFGLLDAMTRRAALEMDRKAVRTRTRERAVAEDASCEIVARVCEADVVRIEQALAALDDQTEQVMRLRARGLGYPEIAAQIGISPTAARQRYSRGLRALRLDLEGTPQKTE